MTFEKDPKQQRQDESSLPGWLQRLLRPVLDLLSRSATLQNIAANSGWLMVERGVSLVVGFFVTVWVVRYLGPEQFGKFSYASSMVGLFGAVASLGLDQIVIRDLVRDDKNQGHLLATAGLLKLVGGLLAAGLAVGIVWSINDDPTTRLLVLVMAGSLVFRAFLVPDLWFQSEVLSKYSVFSRVTALTLISAAKIALIVGGASVVAFGAAQVGRVALVGAGLALAFWLKGASGLEWKPKVSVANDFLKDSWPLIISGLSIAVYMKIDQVMLGEMGTDEQVGLYATAVRLSELWYFIPMVLAGSVFPAVVQTKENHCLEVYHQRMQAFYDVMAGLSYAIALPVVLLAVFIIELLFGAEYGASAPILRVHIWAFVFVSLGVARGKWLVAENMTKFAMLTTLLGGIVNVALNIALLPRWGGLGAAWATLISQAIAAYVSCVLLRDLWPTFGQLTRAILFPIRMLVSPSSLKDLWNLGRNP